MKNTYRAAIVGLGRMGHLFEEDPLMRKPCSHAGAYSYLKDKINIVAACDIRKDRLDKFREKWQVKNLYLDYNEMLEKEKIDILSICTHAQQHKEITIKASKSGVKAIFCEKPISTSINDAEEMIKVCNKNNTLLVINHTRRFDNVWRKSKEVIDSGVIGNIKVINSYSTAGLLNGGIHLFDLLRFYNNDIETVFAKLKKDKSTDASGTGLLKFKNGAHAFVDIDYRDYVLFQINIVGSKGLLKCGGMIRGDKTFELFTSKPSTTQIGLLELQKENFQEVKGEMPLVNAINEIIISIETGKSIISAGEDGLKALEICMAFHESDRTGKEIKLPLDIKNNTVIPRETSFTKDGKFPPTYEKNNILPGF
ncbi:Gfo/Idh/MocA family oxidoreductase [Candidatus Woesearchaeota archaeon]|nr:Gfo/Idh/MocA family oxidoreductase [Candidatus Woesearchaeota archaeon]